MQIVRDLGGYTLGRSDLVRRAMSKKKQAVMEKERANFVYGNAEENVPGCISKGISESVAGQIYEDMMDFAKYAFNKSHAACYAVVSYQTAYLKYYYPVEFMAALLTSVIDNSKKHVTCIFNIVSILFYRFVFGRKVLFFVVHFFLLIYLIQFIISQLSLFFKWYGKFIKKTAFNRFLSYLYKFEENIFIFALREKRRKTEHLGEKARTRFLN